MMEVVRFGLGMRSLRRRRRWTQARLALEARVSRSVVGRIERGRADRVPIYVLVKVAAALGATVSTKLLWQGEGLGRLLDAVHASTTDAVLELLRALGWHTATEVSFNIRGERGTVDILAFHAPSGSLIVIEIKSDVPDLQAMLGILDRKSRLVLDIARDRGCRPLRFYVYRRPARTPPRGHDDRDICRAGGGSVRNRLTNARLVSI